ncbi:hypothetical protein EC968_007017 [Mortierella alpina]|nr:hypothetical protein EC968_007017 [Mortierella alpina]
MKLIHLTVAVSCASTALAQRLVDVDFYDTITSSGAYATCCYVRADTFSSSTTPSTFTWCKSDYYLNTKSYHTRRTASCTVDKDDYPNAARSHCMTLGGTYITGNCNAQPAGDSWV